MSKRYHLSPRETLWACAIVLTFAFINISFLAYATWANAWIQDATGHIIPADFVSFWSTSRMLQMGPAHQVYDWSIHRTAEVELLGPDYDGHLPWLNPPNFLLFVTPLALLSYPLAFLTWILVTFTAYVAAMRTIFPQARSYWISIGACAFPATFSTTLVGQNGFLTGALVAGILGLLNRRPILAGCLLGLLTFKPQFGILFPIVLLADRRWHTFASAVITTLLLLIITVVSYGTDTWLAFLNSLSVTREAILVQGQMGLYKLQSIYGFVVWGTENANAAWGVQAMLAVAVTASIVWVWRKPVHEDVKAAALGAGILLVTPYALIYDFVIFSVPIAFIIRAGVARGFGPVEIPLLTLACLLILAFPLIEFPVGPLAQLIVALVVMERAVMEGRGQSEAPQISMSQAV